MMKHELKTWPVPFAAVKGGQKTCEVRKNDRRYHVGDVLILSEWDPETEKYSGRQLEVEVTYIVKGGSFGLPPDLCVLSISVIPF